MISIVIPVYNEEGSVRLLYNEIIDVFTSNQLDPFEILFVDDGSSDGSAEIMKEIAENDDRVFYYPLKRNYGKSIALSVGFEYANGDVVFTMDADLQDNPSEIPNFLAKLDEGFDMVSGWKKKRNDPLEKKLMSKIFNFVISRASGIRLHDFNCGFKGYKRQVVKDIDVYGEFHRFIPVLAADQGYKIGEIAVSHRKREHGKSKFGIKRYFIGMFDFFSINFILNFSARPFHFIGFWSLIAGLGGLGLLIYTAVVKFGFGETGVRPAFFVSLFLLGFSFQLLIFGLISDLLVSNTRRIGHKPEDYLKKE